MKETRELDELLVGESEGVGKEPPHRCLVQLKVGEGVFPATFRLQRSEETDR